jgi:hypothetical protein
MMPFPGYETDHHRLGQWQSIRETTNRPKAIQPSRIMRSFCGIERNHLIAMQPNLINRDTELGRSISGIEMSR